MKEKYNMIDGVPYDKNGDPIFTKEHKKDWTILVPTMLPIHFKLLKRMLELYGYNVEVLEGNNNDVAQVGLRYVHNDICYPAILVISQLLDAVLSGKYDTHKIGLVVVQTGGGCRASNYLHLLKKGLKKAGYGHVPVLSFNFVGMKTQPGFTFSTKQLLGLLNAICYGDVLMLLKNQCKPYEKNKGETDRLVEFWIEKISKEFENKKYLKYSHIKSNFEPMIESFAKIERVDIEKPKVGIVGENYVKYSPLGNNDLEEFLMEEGAEVYLPGFVDYLLYSVYNGIVDSKLYGGSALYSKILYKIIYSKSLDIINAFKKEGTFAAPTEFKDTIKMHEGYIGVGCKMGEGWLLPAEMVELIHRGVNNIVCAQPFGCLPNHIVGKGMMKIIRERNPEANIVAIDYDASASKINQDNRIKLMLSNAKERLKQDKK